jgi:hypothetical protein
VDQVGSLRVPISVEWRVEERIGGADELLREVEAGVDHRPTVDRGRRPSSLAWAGAAIGTVSATSVAIVIDV